MKKKLTILLSLVLILTIFVFSITSYGLMPTKQSGTQELKATGGWQGIGKTLMFNGVTTSISNADPAYIDIDYNDAVFKGKGEGAFQGTDSSGNMCVFWRKTVKTPGGADKLSAFKLIVYPKNFKTNSTKVIGRSLLDNLFLETSDTSSLEQALINGGTGWVNGIVSVRTSSGSHIELAAKKLWKDSVSSKYGSASKAKQAYTDNSVADLGWNTNTTINALRSLYEIKITLGPFPEIIPDPTAPNLNMDESWTSKDRTFTISGGSNVDHYQYKIGSGSWTKYSSTTTALSKSGETTVQARSVNKAGKVSSAVSKTARVDKTKPTNPKITPTGTAGDNGWYKSNVNYTISGSTDAHSGFDKYQTALNDADWKNGNSGTVSADGTTKVWARALDKVGNASDSVTLDVKIDKTAPTLTLSPTSQDWTNSNVEYTIKSSDSTSGIADTQYRTEKNGTWSHGASNTWNKISTSFSGTISDEGTHRIETWTKDKAGNEKTVTSGYYYIDKTMPKHLSHDITGQTYKSGNDYWFKGGGTGVFTDEMEDPLSGYHTLYARFRGLNVNFDSRSRHRAAKNSTTDNDNWSRTDDSLKVTAAKRTSSSGGKEKIDWTFELNNNEYDYDVMYYYRDKAGNAYEDRPNVTNAGYDSTGMKVRVDNTKPTVTANTSSTDWDNKDASVTLTYADARSGVKTKQYKWTNSTEAPTSWSDYSSAVTQSSNGTWYLHARVVDNVGYETKTYFGPYRIDKTAPTVTISPNSRDWGNSNVSASVSISDSGGSGFKQCRYRVETNGSWGSWSGWSTSSTISLSLSDKGSIRVEIEAQDNAGNTTTATSGYFRIDKTDPTITATPEGSEWNNGSVSVTLNFSDDHSGIATRQYEWSTSKTTPTSWSNYSDPVTQSSDGTWYLHARAVDNAGNVTTQSFGPYSIDKTAPSGTFTPNSRDWGKDNVTISFTPTDSGGSGVANWEYTIRRKADGTIYKESPTSQTGTQSVSITDEGEYYMEVEVFDNAGNSGTVKSGDYKIDRTVPTIGASPTTRDWSNADADVELTFNDSLSGIETQQYAWADTTATPASWTNYTGAVKHTTTGVKYLHAKAVDKAGNETIKYFGPYKVDKELPTVTANPSSAAWGNSEVSVTLTYGDTGGSLVKDKQYAWSEGTDTPSSWKDYTAAVKQAAEGVWYLHARVTDNAGNVVTQRFGPYKIDNTAPGGSFSPNSSDWGNSDVTVKFTPTDSGGSEVYRSRYKTSNNDGSSYGSWSSYINGSSAFDITLSTEGLNKIQVEVYDNAGNRELFTSGSYMIDKTVPTVSASPSTTDWGNSSVQVKLNFNDAASGVNTKQYAWSTSTTTPTNWNNYTTDVVQNDQGVWYLHARVVDNAGNETATYFGPYRVDKDAPSISASPANRGWDKTDAKVTLTFSDSHSGISARQYAWSTSTATPSSWKTYSSEVTQSSNGTWYLHARAVDNAGNVETECFGPYRVDKAAPTIDANPKNRGWENSDVSVTLTFSDSHSEISTRQCAWSTSTSTPSSWSTYSSAVTQSNNGAWYLHARAVDNAGNETVTYFGPYRIDKQPPTEPNLNLDQSWINGDRTFTVTGGSDAHSGVARLEYRIGSGAWTTYTTTTTALTTSGTIEVQARTVDNAGNVSEVVAKTARVDKDNPQPPTLNLDESWTNQDRTFTVTGGSDAHSGVAQLEYRIGTGSWNKYSSTTTALTTSGTVDVQARTKDNVGLYSTVITKTARVDKIKPSHTSHSIYGARYVSGNDYWVRPGDLIKYKDRGYDAHSGITTSYVRLYNGSTDARSRHQWTGSATNNDYWSKDIKVEIVSAARTYDSGGYREIEWGISPNNYEQDYDIQWHYIDLARNESDSYGSSGFKLRVDNTPPTIKADRSDSGWSKDNISITMTYTDGRSGIKTKQYAWSKNTSTPTSWNNYTSPVSPSSDGVWYLHARAEDNVGFIATECFGPYRIDKTGPIIDANPKNRDWDKSNVTVTLNFSDSESGVSVKQYDWSTSTATPTSWSNYTSAVTQSSNGVWYLHARAVDTAGNITTTYFGPYRIDKTAPTISASPKNRDWSNTDAVVQLTFNDTGGSSISGRQFKWSTSENTPTSWDNYTAAVKQTSTGVWYLHAKATDVAGNETVMKFGPYHVDKVAPTHTGATITEFRLKDGNTHWFKQGDVAKVNLKSYDANSRVERSQLGLMGTGIDIRSIYSWITKGLTAEKTGTQFKITGGREITNGTTREYQYDVTMNPGDWTSGVWYLYRDIAGTWSSVDDSGNGRYLDTGLIIRTDNTPPVITGSTLTHLSPTEFTYKMDATDAAVGLHAQAYMVNVDNTDGAYISNNTYTIGGLKPNTKYTVKFKARDRLENVSGYSAPVADYTLANIPNNLIVVQVGNDVKITWGANGNPSYTRYHLQWSRDDSFDGSNLLGELLTTDLQHELKGIDLGREAAYFRVRAINNSAVDKGVTVEGISYEGIPTEWNTKEGGGYFGSTGFTVTKIADHRWKDYFQGGNVLGYDRLPAGDGTMSYGDIGLGYGINFSVGTYGLDRDSDTVEIETKFFTIKTVGGIKSTDKEVTFEYNGVELPDDMFNKIILKKANRRTVDSKTQTWSGEFFLPAGIIAKAGGVEVDLKDVLVLFKITLHGKDEGTGQPVKHNYTEVETDWTNKYSVGQASYKEVFIYTTSRTVYNDIGVE